MIYFNFDISWPKTYEMSDSQVDYIEVDKPISTNKNIQVQLSKSCNFGNLIGIRIDTNWTGHDHAGPEIEIKLYRFFFIFKIYDKRHWNWETGNWYTEAEALAEYEEWKKEKAND